MSRVNITVITPPDSSPAQVLVDGKPVVIINQNGTVETHPQVLTDYGINPATGRPNVGVAGYVSEVAQLVNGQVSTDPITGWQAMSEAERNGPARFFANEKSPYAVKDGAHYNIPLPESQAKFLFTGASAGDEIAVHIAIPKPFPAHDNAHTGFVAIGGKRSGELTGGVAAAAGGRKPFYQDEGTIQGTQITFTVEANNGAGNDLIAGDTLSIFIRFDGGDAEFYLDVAAPNRY